MEQHKLLKRQINKFLTEDLLQNQTVLNFINAINDSYFSFERDKEILNHAFYESEKEYQSLNSSLKLEYELKKQSISKLYDSLDIIDENHSDINLNDEVDDLLFISKYLNLQVEKQKKNELAINSLVLLQQMLMEIASDFIKISPDKINETKFQTLKKLGQFVTADRAYIFEYDFKNQTCSNTFEWCNEGVEPQLENLQNISLDLMKEWVDSNLRGEIMSIPKVEELPKCELKQILSQQEIKSLLVLPILGKSECLGFVGFDSVKSHYNYSNKEKDLLFFFAQMIANVDERSKIELDLKYNNELQKTLLSNIQSGIVFEDANNTILFANRLFCNMFSISDAPENLFGINCEECLEVSKDLFVEPDKFSERVAEIIHKKVLVTGEILEMKNGTFLERHYIPLIINNEYKGHLWKYNDITQRVKSQNLLEQSEERNRLIMESALNAIISIDSRGNINFWNKQAEQIFGWKKEEVLGKKLQDNIIPKQHKEGHSVGLKRYMESGEGPVLNKLLELPALKKDGSEVLVEIAIIPIKQDDEMFFCSFIQDISERKKAENQLKFQEKKYRNIIANMNLGLIEVDSNELIQFANQSFCNISGYDLNELIGKNPAHLFLDESDKKILESKHKLRAQGVSDIYQVPIKNKDGENKWWAISGAPNFDENGNLIGTIGIHLDITEQKKLEIELEKEKEKALEASKAKEIFLATMSHEIRTPLNAIIGFLRELNKHALSQEQKTYIENSSIASSHLLSIINNVLDISKIESGEMELESVTFDLKHTIDKVVRILGVKAKEKGITLNSKFNSEISNLLIGDPFRIEQILYNLIGNSLKFTNEGSVDVECDLITDFNEEQEILISILDTGIGIEESYLDSIFTKFSQEEKNTTRKFGGTGLGMTITKELVDLMNGSIVVESKKNIGTKISIILKLNKGIMNDNINNKQEDNLSNLSLENKKVLLVEDNEFNRIVAQNSLKYFKCIVVEAINGLDALEKIKQHDFDVILMDVQMPIMDGIEATTIIREDLKINTPIIALTANAFKTEIEKFKSVGINDYLTKPFDENVLYKAIVKAISQNNSSEPAIIENIKPSYDLSSIIAISRGDEEFVKKMITLFIKQTSEACIDLERYVGENNFSEISKLIHKIKPNIEGMGITSILDEIRELELLCENSNDIEKVKILVSKINATLCAAIAELEKIN
jgi:PAS domain S-box-containing protein